MKRIFWVFLFTFLISTCYAQQTGQLMRGQSPTGKYPFISVDESGRLNTTSSIGTVPVSITTQFVATDSANRLQINVASCSVSSVPVKITNFDDMPFADQVTYATNTDDMLRVSIASAEILLASPVAVDDASRTVINIGSYSTVIPASITNFPATTELVTNDDHELLVAISSQSSTIIASISNLPSVQQLKVDGDSNLTVNLASNTIGNLPVIINAIGTSTPLIASISNFPESQTFYTDTPGNLLVNIASITATGSTLYTDDSGNLIVKIASDTTGTKDVNVLNLASDSSGRIKVSIDAIGTSTPLIASISNLPATQQFVVDDDGNLAINLASSSATVGVQVDQNYGYKTIVTPSFSVTGAKTNIGEMLPSGTKGFTLYVYNGDLITNSFTNLATGSIPIGNIIASGSSMKFDGIASATDIWGASNNGDTLTCVLVGW